MFHFTSFFFASETMKQKIQLWIIYDCLLLAFCVLDVRFIVDNSIIIDHVVFMQLNYMLSSFGERFYSYYSSILLEWTFDHGSLKESKKRIRILFLICEILARW